MTVGDGHRTCDDRGRDLIDSVFDVSLDGIVVHDPVELRLLRANAAYCLLVGYSEQKLRELPIDEIWIREPGDLRLLRELGDLGMTRGEVTLRRVDGSRIRVETASVLTESSYGQVIVSVVRDITDRVQREAELRASEERFAAFMRHSPASAFVKDELGRYVYASDRWLELLPVVARDSWRGATDEEIYPAAIAAEFRANDAAMLAHDETIELIETNVDRDGEPAEYLTIKFPFSGANGVRYLGGIALDVTERRRERALLVESEERYRSLVAVLEEGIVFQDATGAIVAANASAERILGLSLDQLQGRTSVDPRWRAIREDGTPFAGEEHPAMVTLRTGEACSGVLMGLEKPDGGPTWISINTQPVVHAGAEAPHAVVASFRDVTEERVARAERDALVERQRELERLESLAALAGGIAHDFNNILTAIRGNLELVREDAAPERGRRVSRMLTMVEQATRLTDRMLDYAGRRLPELERVDIGELAEGAVRPLRTVIDPGVSLILTAEAGMCVRGAPEQLAQAVLSVVLNAIEATVPGGGKVHVHVGPRDVGADELERAHVLGHGLEPGRYVAVVVTDTGTGMDAETVGRIFDPFFTTNVKGRGLGLSSVLGIVRGHAGTIAVDSQPGQGSTVTILLPLAAAELMADPASGAGVVAAPAAGTLLVVDDHPDVRDLTAELLRRSGHDVRVAASGEAALEELERGEFALVVLDVTMPGMSGPAVVTAMRAREDTTPVLLVSGYDADGALAGASDAVRRLDFLQKPFGPGELLERVRRAIADATSPSSS